jgi:hypothetical protein
MFLFHPASRQERQTSLVPNTLAMHSGYPSLFALMAPPDWVAATPCGAECFSPDCVAPDLPSAISSCQGFTRSSRRVCRFAATVLSPGSKGVFATPAPAAPDLLEQLRAPPRRSRLPPLAPATPPRMARGHQRPQTRLEALCVRLPNLRSRVPDLPRWDGLLQRWWR